MGRNEDLSEPNESSDVWGDGRVGGGGARWGGGGVKTRTRLTLKITLFFVWKSCFFGQNSGLAMSLTLSQGHFEEFLRTACFEYNY